VGSTTKLSAVRWGVAGRIIWAWILTIPAVAGTAIAAWYLLYVFGVAGNRKNKSPFGAATLAARLPAPPTSGYPVPTALAAHPARCGSPVGAARSKA
jgi:hypothetical protein